MNKGGDPSVFLDANIWPEGSLVRWWRHKKDSASTSRVSSDTSDEHCVHTLMYRGSRLQLN